MEVLFLCGVIRLHNFELPWPCSVCVVRTSKYVESFLLVPLIQKVVSIVLDGNRVQFNEIVVIVVFHSIQLFLLLKLN